MTVLNISGRQTGKTTKIVLDVLTDIKSGRFPIVVVRNKSTRTLVCKKGIANNIQTLPIERVITLNELSELNHIHFSHIYVDEYLFIPVEKRKILHDILTDRTCVFTAYSSENTKYDDNLLQFCRKSKDGSNPIMWANTMGFDFTAFSVEEYLDHYYNVLSDPGVIRNNIWCANHFISDITY